MALRVWLPLNGNLNNQGLSNIQINNTGAIINNAGKIGQAYEFGANHWLRLENYAAEFLTYKEFTLSVWFKCTARNTSHGGSALISGGNWNQPANLLNLALSGWTTDHYTRLIISGSGTWDAGYNYNFNLNTWYHVALTSGNGKMRAYVNGELIGDSYSAFTPASLEQDWICIGNGTYYSGFIFNGLMNDVRIYDECLSPKQVKEISKGLIAHYKLTGVGANKNYIKNSDWSNKTNGGIYTFDGDVVTFHSDTLAASGISFTQTVDSAGITDFKNKKLTFSMEYQITEALTFGTTNPWVGFEIGLTRNTTTGGSSQWLDWYGGKSIPTAVTNGWVKKSFTVTVTNYDIANSSLGVSFFMRDTTGTIKYRHPKIEIGEVATDWIPHESDALYTKLGYDNNIYTDDSGNGYTATKKNTLTFSADSPRYNGSTSFSGTSLLNAPVASVLATSKDFTIGGWFKRASGTTYYSSTSSSTVPVCLENARFFIYDSGGQSYVGTWSCTNNVWQHIVLVHDSVNKTLTLFVNGVQTKQITTSGTIYNREVLNIGGRNNGGQFNGLISDFRVYATALSATEILTMYQTSGIIDNKNKVYAYEFKEE